MKIHELAIKNHASSSVPVSGWQILMHLKMFRSHDNGYNTNS